MQELLPQVRQFAVDKTTETVNILNQLSEVARILAAVRDDYGDTFSKVFVIADAGKYKGELLPVVRIQLDADGVVIWASHGDPRPFKVTGTLEVVENGID